MNKKYFLCEMIFLLFLISACSTSEVQSEKSNEPIVSSEYRLVEDRAAFDEIRKQIPEEKQIENDEVSYLLNLMGNENRNPSEVRTRFDDLVRKKREKFNKDMTRKREEFTKEQRKEREAFDSELKDDRSDFSKSKHTPDQRKEFYGDLDQKRKDFYANQKENRDKFESDLKDKRKDFEDYIKTKQKDFTENLKIYTREFNEREKLKKDRDKRIMQEYEPIRQKPAHTLRVGN